MASAAHRCAGRRRRAAAILCLGGGLATTAPGAAFSLQEPMRSAGGRYAYVAPVMEGGGAEADEVPAPALPRIEIASLDAAQDVELSLIHI